MNLYVWRSPFKVSYGDSMLYAVGETVEEALENARKAGVSEYGHNPDSRDMSYVVDQLGDPDRIIPCPCAEFYRFQE